MPVVTRALARSFLSVRRQAIPGPRAAPPAVLCRAGPDGLTLTASGGDAAVRYHDPAPQEPGAVALVATALALFEGPSDDPVTLTLPRRGRGEARWDEAGTRDGRGAPLAVRITDANRNESLEALSLVDDIPPIRGRRGRPRRKPKALYGDRPYGTPRNHRGLKERRIEDHLAQQRTPHGSGLGTIRWIVESVLSWVGQARRLKVRYEVLPAMHRAFHYLQLARICCKILQRDF